MRTRATVVAFAPLFLLAASARAADAPAPITVDLWPGPPPGETGEIPPEKADRTPDGKAIRSLTNVTKPTLTIHRPDPARSTGAVMVVCPGGGYNNLAWDHEGEMVARWLDSIGVTAALLKYRVPRRPGAPRDQPPPQALMDAQRAIGLVRSHASEWGVDPGRVGILGFSAGGHLASWASTRSAKRAYEPVDDADKASARPDFAVVVYPGGVVRRGTIDLAPEIAITPETPPFFLAHAGDDPVSPENSIALYLALERAKVPAELHIYASGGHGFGMRPREHPTATWPRRCEDWMRERGLLKPKPTP